MANDFLVVDVFTDAADIEFQTKGLVKAMTAPPDFGDWNFRARADYVLNILGGLGYSLRSTFERAENIYFVMERELS